MLSQQDLTEYFQASAETYRFLSQALLKELSEEAIEHIAAAEFPDDTGNANLDRGYALVKRYFSFSSAERRTQLACEYARIFLAAGVYIKERRTAIPYESVFTSDKHLKKNLYATDITKENANVVVLNATGVSGVAQKQADKLTELGMTVSTVGNAPQNGSYSSNKIYKVSTRAKTATSIKLQSLYGAAPEAIQSVR